MDQKEINEITTKAIETYGQEPQIWMTIEEMSELGNALAKYRRDRVTKSDICEEIADVLIMCIQMSKIFGEDRVKQMFEDKLIRLKESLDLNPNANWALEDEAQTKVEENKSLFEKLRKDYVAKHWETYREYAIENKFFNNTLINDFIKTISVYATLVNPNDNEMIDTYNNLPQIEV